MARSFLVLVLAVSFFSCSKGVVRPAPILPTRPTPTISNFNPDNGAVGTVVTITGFNFSLDPAQNTVRFNGIATPVDSANHNTLIVKVPSGALTGRITVTVNGYSNTSAKTFTVFQGIWNAGINFPDTPRGKTTAFSINGNAYVLGSYSSGEPQTNLWEYDTTTNQWTQRADYPGLAKSSYAVFTIGRKAYVGLGYDSTTGYHNDFWEFDPANNIWTRKTDFPGKPREAAIAFGFANTGIIGLGGNITTDEFNYTDIWRYSPSSNQWTKMNDFPGTATWSASSVAIDSIGYVFFGGSSPDDGTSNDLWTYHPSSDKWISTDKFPGENRVDATAFVINKRIYAGFGIDRGNAFRDMWEYNPGNFTWIQRADCDGVPRYGAVGFSLGNKGFVGLGFAVAGQPLNDFWIFTL